MSLVIKKVAKFYDERTQSTIDKVFVDLHRTNFEEKKNPRSYFEQIVLMLD